MTKRLSQGNQSSNTLTRNCRADNSHPNLKKINVLNHSYNFYNAPTSSNACKLIENTSGLGLTCGMLKRGTWLRVARPSERSK